MAKNKDVAADGVGEKVDGSVQSPVGFGLGGQPSFPAGVPADYVEPSVPEPTPEQVAEANEPNPLSRDDMEFWIDAGVGLSAGTNVQYEFNRGAYRAFNEDVSSLQVQVDAEFVRVGEELSVDHELRFLFKGGVLMIYNLVGTLLIVGAGYDQLVSLQQ